MLLSQIDGHKKDNNNSIEKLFLTENDVSSSCHQRGTKKNSELPMRNQPPNLNFVYLRFESSEGLDILVCCLTILKDFKASLLQNTMLWTFPINFHDRQVYTIVAFLLNSPFLLSSVCVEFFLFQGKLVWPLVLAASTAT